jgi:hypothetical protein
MQIGQIFSHQHGQINLPIHSVSASIMGGSRNWSKQFRPDLDWSKPVLNLV